jgi:hypothetical protein
MFNPWTVDRIHSTVRVLGSLKTGPAQGQKEHFGAGRGQTGGWEAREAGGTVVQAEDRGTKRKGRSNQGPKGKAWGLMDFEEHSGEEGL